MIINLSCVFNINIISVSGIKYLVYSHINTCISSIKIYVDTFIDVYTVTKSEF